jgi:4-alpha-glucanotransferase
MTPHPLARRARGILLHPGSLPGTQGGGTLGRAAREFADFLAAAGQRLWQVLPLVPTGLGDSPYQSPSSLAGNPALVDLEDLAAGGLLGRSDLSPLERLPRGHVDYAALLPLKAVLLARAARAFLSAPGAERQALERFRAEEADWLEPHARFMALKDAHGGAPWTDWTRSEPDAEAVAAHAFVQFAFFRQWGALRAHCAERAIQLVGDMPLFVAHDSADVWRQPHLFDLDAAGAPRAVAGVPPDYFSATGQLWGNPLYRWEAMREEDFAWWRRRVRAALRLVDVVRIDHFRGLESYYEIPAGAPDATGGRWVQAPGAALLESLRSDLGALPFIAEDLGLITPEVDALRDRFSLPGMRVLQFAFMSEDGADPHKPHNYVPNAVAYTGTHDNDTLRGWLAAERPTRELRAERMRALRYVGARGRDAHWAFVRAVQASVARTAIVPVQDVLGLGSEARLNTPARAEGNWSWRLGEGALTRRLADRLRELCRLYGR